MTERLKYNIEIIDERGWTDIRDKINQFVFDMIMKPEVTITFEIKKELEK